MGKNRVAPDRPFRRKDNFFTKSKRTDFKAKNKFKQNDKSKPFKKSFKEKNDAFKPSVSGGNDFFVKPVDKTDLSSSENTETKVQKEKKPFDKKTWRLQKYSRKYKLQQWEDKRKKAVLRGYYRNIKEDEDKLDVKKIYEENKSDDEEDDNDDGRINEENENNLNKNVDSENTPAIEDEPAKGSKQKKNKAFKKAHLEFERIKNEKKIAKEEKLKKKEEKEKALVEYKKKKAEKFKKLNKKTKKGQPIMKDRLEMLLERIQKSVTN